MRDIGQPTPGDDGDDDVVMTQEEPGVKCPYTQQVMTDPVRNTICGHNYEKSAIQEFIFRRNGNARYTTVRYGGGNSTTAEEVSRFQRLFPIIPTGWCRRASRHQKLAPTFPGIDSCLMVTKRDFLEMEASL